MTQIEKRNLTDTITECFAEHQVDLDGKDGVAYMYLIEVSRPGSLAEDFIDTYKGEIDEFKEGLAKKMWPEDARQKYGVLVDQDLKYVFAFNREFADLKTVSPFQKIEFSDPEKLLIGDKTTDDSNKKKNYLKAIWDGEMTVDEVVEEIGNDEDFLKGMKNVLEGVAKDSRKRERMLSSTPSWEDMNTVMRYSLTGNKGSNRQGSREVTFERASLLDRIKEIYEKNTVTVDGKNYSLVEITYQTDTLTDFNRTYDGELDAFDKKLADKLFAKEKEENKYTLLLNEELQIKFAYNNIFASYNADQEGIVYKPAKELLLEMAGGKELPVTKSPPKFTPSSRPSGSTRMRYSLTSKKE
jgi:hypothetical protein